MIISAVKKDNLHFLYFFLKENEEKCVYLIDNLRNKTTVFYLLYEDSKKIIGVIAITKTGTLFNFIKNIDATEKEKENIAKTLRKYSIFCINGEKNGSVFLISLLQKYCRKQAKIINFYNYMMKNPQHKIMSNCKIKISIKQCYQSDVKNILPLELGYQKEEILPQGHTPDPKIYSAFICKQLEKQFIFCAKVEDEGKEKFVSKVATNAISWNYAQLGGVYTLPEYRQNWIAFSLIDYVCSFLEKMQKKVILFVNTQNLPAQFLYKKCGFVEYANNCIAYY